MVVFVVLSRIFHKSLEGGLNGEVDNVSHATNVPAVDSKGPWVLGSIFLLCSGLRKGFKHDKIGSMIVSGTELVTRRKLVRVFPQDNDASTVNGYEDSPNPPKSEEHIRI